LSEINMMSVPQRAPAHPLALMAGVLLLGVMLSASARAPANGQPTAGTGGTDSGEAAPIVLAMMIDVLPPEPKPGAYSPDQVNRIMAHIRNREYDQALALSTTMTEASPAEPTGWKLQGAAFFGKGDLASARKSFERALAVQPGDNQALVYLAQLDLAQNDPASARKRYESILAADAKYVPALIGLAQVEVASKNEKSAADWFEKARDAEPGALLPRLYLGNYYLKSGDLAAASAEATEVTRLFPDNPDALDLLGHVQLASGLDSQAERTFRKLVAAAPKSVSARMRLATTQIKLGDAAGAAATLRAALQIDPDDVDAAYMLGTLDAKAGRYDEALKLARKVQSTQAKSPLGFVMEGDVFVAQRKYAEAQKAYERGFEINKTTLIAVKIHQAREGAGHAIEANAELLQWMNAHPDDLAGWQYLAGAYVRSGQRKAAIDQYERLVKINPKNSLALNNLAGLYQMEKDPRALSRAEQAYALAPDSPVAADTLGWIHIEQGNPAKGLELVRKALDRDPNNPEVRYHAAVGLAKSGNKAGARRELEKLLAEGKPFEQRQAAMDLLKQL
jgi:putative PEP-CTERM system TPR-repeat lipoprotein